MKERITHPPHEAFLGADFPDAEEGKYTIWGGEDNRGLDEEERYQTLAVNPKGLSFIQRMASASSFTDMIPTTGPKVSSVMTRIE